MRLMPPGIRGLMRAGVLWLAFLPKAAHSAITITAPAIPLPYTTSGQTGTFEVYLQSTASPQPQVGAFGVELQLPSFGGLAFVPPPAPTTNTTPTAHAYIFSGQSPTESVANAGRTVFGGDFASSNPVPTLFNNAGLLLVTYSVPAGATGVYPLTFVDYSNQNQLGTALFDQNNVQIPTTDLDGSMAILPPTAYWHGTTDGVWTTDNLQTGATNWTIDAAGTTDTHIAPGASTDVFFVGSGAMNLNTTLGADFSIKGLTFTSTAASPVTISGNRLTLGADGLAVQVGSAADMISSTVTLGGSQTWDIANDAGAPLTIAGPLTVPASATLTKSDGGMLRVTGAPSLGNNSVLAINGGSIKFAMSAGSPTIGTGVTATVAAGAQLELAGTVSALSSTVAPSQRVNVANSSTAPGLFVLGTNQQIGAINGTGTTSVAAGGSLTANSIVQSALVIGGAAGNPGRLTIEASDSSGNPLELAGGDALAVAGFSAAAELSSRGITASGASSLIGGGLSGGSFARGAAIGTANAAGVPEPTSMFYSAVAVAGGFFALRRRQAPPSAAKTVLA
jgi:hypothetical protein